MIDIGRGDQENFEKKIVAKVHKKFVINPPSPDSPDENVQKSPISLRKRVLFLARIIILCYGPILSKIGPSFGTFLVVSYFYFYIFSSPISIVRVLEWWVVYHMSSTLWSLTC